MKIGPYLFKFTDFFTSLRLFRRENIDLYQDMRGSRNFRQGGGGGGGRGPSVIKIPDNVFFSSFF